MVPAAYVALDALPLNPNGKLDRSALPAPRSEAFAARGYEPPQGKTEQTLSRIWAGLLRVERVGRHDNFFELGPWCSIAAQSQSDKCSREVPIVHARRSSDSGRVDVGGDLARRRGIKIRRSA